MGLSQIDTHFLKMAAMQTEADAGAINKKGTTRARRGAVIARNNELVSKGVSQHLGGNLYKPDDEERYVATVNAEQVALGEAVRAGQNIGTCTIYCSDCPNWYTFKTIITLGIRRVVHYGPVSNDRISHYARELGIEVISV